MLFEDFDPNPKFDGITIQELQQKTPVELAWFILGYPKHQPRAWGQWLAKQPEPLSLMMSKFSRLEMTAGSMDDSDVEPLGKWMKDSKNIQSLTDFVALLNKTYPGVDYK
jgi:hypothetical protein